MSQLETAMISLPSLESLYIELFRDQLRLATGTAFVCENEGKLFLVSNWHNFSGRNNETDRCLSMTLAVPNQVKVYFHTAQSIDSTVARSFPLLDREENRFWFEHPVYGRRVDIAILPIDVDAEIRLFPVSWKNPMPLAQRVGIPAKVVGYPFGKRINSHLPVWATGHLASEPEVDVDGLPLMLIDCRTRKGSSGSPVVLHYPQGMMYPHQDGSASYSNADVTRLLGIYSGRISVGSDIGRVWKLSAIVEIVKSIVIFHPKTRIGRVESPRFS